MMSFDRYTEDAQAAATKAYEILQRYGHGQIDSGHILLALLEQPDGFMPQLLEHLGVDSNTMRSRLDEILRASPKGLVYGHHLNQVFITPRVKRIIDFAYEQAIYLQDERISSEHIFLGITSEIDTPIAKLLADSGITFDRATAIIKNLRSA